MRGVFYDITPGPRLDLLVSAVDGSPRRLTTYSGTVTLAEDDDGFLANSEKGPNPESLWIPDGLAYRSPPETIVTAMWPVLLRHQQYASNIGLDPADTTAEPDPRGGLLWFLQLHVSIHKEGANGVCGYRIDVLAEPDQIEPDDA